MTLWPFAHSRERDNTMKENLCNMHTNKWKRKELKRNNKFKFEKY